MRAYLSLTSLTSTRQQPPPGALPVRKAAESIAPACRKIAWAGCGLAIGHEREAWELAARRDGRTLSAWIVRRCNGEPTTAPVPPAHQLDDGNDDRHA